MKIIQVVICVGALWYLVSRVDFDAPLTAGDAVYLGIAAMVGLGVFRALATASPPRANELPMPTTMVVVIFGDGRLVGPFSECAAAQDYARSYVAKFGKTDWHLGDLHPPISPGATCATS